MYALLMTPSLLLSAPNKSSGKTTLTIGISAALAARGLEVQTFKKGPDYIDPMWLTNATERPCHNLDFNTQAEDEILRDFHSCGRDADIALVEGNMGLFDSIDVEGKGSNASMASLLGTPVILVLSAQGTTRSLVPLLLGYQAFDPSIKIAGVLLNRVAGSRHEKRLREVIGHYSDIPIVGAVHRNAQLSIDEEHLGLVPSNESSNANDKIQRIRSIIEEQVDLDLLLELAGPKTVQTQAPPSTTDSESAMPYSVRIGIPRDKAFGFYYEGDLDALRAAGAELVFFNAIEDPSLPTVDGLFIGGGFPERYLDELGANASLMQDIAEAIDHGLPTYAECGGLMYLSRSISWDEQTRSMVNIIPTDITMHKRPIGRGYIQLQETEHCPWPINGHNSSATFPAHEFHYSSASPLETDKGGEPARYAYQVLRGTGMDGKRDGFVYKNLLANYAHLRDVDNNHWAERFVNFVRQTTPNQTTS